MAIGAVVGGVAGAYVGKEVAETYAPTTAQKVIESDEFVLDEDIAEAHDPMFESAYWRATYGSRPYYEASTPFEEYEPAYRYGWESRAVTPGRTWNEAEPQLESGWETAKFKSQLTWEHARHAARDAWHRFENEMPGTSTTLL
jgi:hypothetical protein